MTINMHEELKEKLTKLNYMTILKAIKTLQLLQDWRKAMHLITIGKIIYEENYGESNTCISCEKTFLNKDTLQFHYDVVHKLNLYTCKFCKQKEIIDMYFKYNHYITEHNQENTLAYQNLEILDEYMKCTYHLFCRKQENPLEYLNLMYTDANE